MSKWSIFFFVAYARYLAMTRVINLWVSPGTLTSNTDDRSEPLFAPRIQEDETACMGTVPGSAFHSLSFLAVGDRVEWGGSGLKKEDLRQRAKWDDRREAKESTALPPHELTLYSFSLNEKTVASWYRSKSTGFSQRKRMNKKRLPRLRKNN